MVLAASKIAFNIVWSDIAKYNKVIINLGPFHVICSYLNTRGKMVSASGFEDIVIESNICASGSIHQVLSGKHFNSATRVHQLVLSALEQLLIDEFVQRNEIIPRAFDAL